MRRLDIIVAFAVLFLLMGSGALAQQLVQAPREDGASTQMRVYAPSDDGCAPLALISPGASGNENGYQYLGEGMQASGLEVHRDRTQGEWRRRSGLSAGG